MGKFTKRLFKNTLVLYRATSSTSAQSSSAIGPLSQLPTQLNENPPRTAPVQDDIVDSIGEQRKRIAPWISIGTYQKGLLSHLSTGDIIRALFVLRMCSYNFLVSQSQQLFDISRKFGPFGEWVMRKTFFNQFVGGDSLTRMKSVVESMQQRKLILMVAPVLEEDVEDKKSSKKTYDDNLDTLFNIATMTSDFEKRKPIVQLKLTAIMPANTLEKVSRAIETKMNSRNIPANIITNIANSIENPGSLDLKISSDDATHFIDGFKRANSFVQRARELKVFVLVDAEFFGCKPAISAIAMALMARHNSRNHFVGNTIQAYLKESQSAIKGELDTITKEIGVNWYGKIVRGAYMDRERHLAQKNSYASPICDSYAATSSSYDEIVQNVLENLALNSERRSHLLVATHNEKSIRLAAQNMRELNIDPNRGSVSFAQIYGMADYLSTPLVAMGYKVYKSTPYGPIGKVMPYLARRASENRSVMQGAREERTMLANELRARLVS